MKNKINLEFQNINSMYCTVKYGAELTEKLMKYTETIRN